MAGDAQTGAGPLGSRWRLAAWGTAAALLLLPLVAMQLSVEWHGTWPTSPSQAP